MLNVYFAASHALEQLWFVVAFSLVANALVAAYAVRGARW